MARFYIISELFVVNSEAMILGHSIVNAQYSNHLLSFQVDNNQLDYFIILTPGTSIGPPVNLI